MPADTASNSRQARNAPANASEKGRGEVRFDDELAGVSLDTFADACDRTPSAASATGLLTATARRLGFDKVIVATHNFANDVGSLAVLAHNCEPSAIKLFVGPGEGVSNPLFKAAGRGNGLIRWDDKAFRRGLSHAQRRWLEDLARSGLRRGVTQRIRTSLVPASCSLTPAREDVGEEAVRAMMRAGAYVFHHLIMLQRPKLAPSALLTLREHQCLALASLAGMRPREVAEALGVSVNTVRTIRQRACARLGARSQEEAIWRMVETGQLFLPGRISRPRSW